MQAQQPARFLLYGVKDGLSQNSVHAVFRDRDGLVWVGTQDGLNSFDGKDFTVYRHNDEDSNTISDQFVVNIQEDQKGDLWIGTRNGLNCFNKYTQKFRRYYVDPQEPHNFQADYTDFFIQDDGKIAVLRSSLFIIDPVSGKTAEIHSPGDKKCNWFITPSYKTWCINEDNTLYYSPDIRKAKLTAVGPSPFSSKENYSEYKAIPGRDSLLFIYNKIKKDELLVFGIADFYLRQKISLPSNFLHLNINSPDDIIASYAGGIYFTGINKEALFIKSGSAEGLPPGAVLASYKDREGNLWIGTSGNGLAVSNGSFNNYDLVKPPVPQDVITGIAKNAAGLYLSTRTGLYLFNENDNSKKITALLSGKNITAVCTDLQQNIWAAVQYEGITILDKNGRRIKTFVPGNNPNAVVMHMENSSGNGMMISTTAGFFVMSSLHAPPIAFSETNSTHELRGNYIMSSFEDRDGNTWISNNNGLDVFGRKLEKKFSFQSSDDKSSFLKRTIITSVTQDSSGAIWIGTIRGGIYKYSGGNIVHYTISSGLASDVVYNIVCDSRNRIWATTSAGLNIFNERQNAFTTLTPADGVPTAAYIFGSVWHEKNELYFGTSEGLLICHTDKIDLRETNISAYVADVKVNGQSISTEDGRFEIMPDDKLISFELAVSPAFFSGNIIYQYRLLGQQEAWTTLPQGIHTISYTGLPYKELSMEVRAAGSLNNLAGAPVNTIKIKSKAPFWKTGAFIFAVILLLVVILILAVADYNRKNYKKQLQQLKMEKVLQGERVRIGRDLHDNIGAYTSALIAGLNHIRPANSGQEKQVTDLKEYGASIMGFLRETIWMLNAETLSVTAFADRFKNYTLRISNNYPGIDFSFNVVISKDKTLLPSVMLNLFRILQEALQNACKHSGGNKITFSVNSAALLYFEIKDNGSGFGEKLQTGHYGLANMKQRATEAGFLLNVTSNDEGVIVSLSENTANAALRGDAEKV